MATITSVGSGLWSAAGTWDIGVPADGDDVVIVSGHTVTFDVNQSAFVTGVKITINGKLNLTTVAGTYHMQLKNSTTAISGTGTLELGTQLSPIPNNVKLLITGSGSVCISTAYTIISATEPVNKFVRTTSSEAVGSTALEVDTDLTGDTWELGDPIYIQDYKLTAPAAEKYTITNITSSTIEITPGLTTTKEIGSYIVLAKRNIHIYTTSSVSDRTFKGNSITLYSLSFDGRQFINGAGYNYPTVNIYGGVFYTTLYGFTSGYITVHDGVFINWPSSTSTINIKDGLFLSSKVPSSIASHIYGGTWIRAQLPNSSTSVYNGAEFMFQNQAEWFAYQTVQGQDYSSSPVNFNVPVFNALDTKFGVTEVINASLIPAGAYAESINHNQVSGAYKAWSSGGVVTSITSPLPPGYSLAYLHALGVNDRSCINERKFIVRAGEIAVIEVYLRKTKLTTFLPRVYLAYGIYNPCIFLSSNVDEFIMSDSIDTWENHTFTIDNSSSVENKPYSLWFMGQRNAEVSTNMYSAYKIEYSGSGGSGGSVKILPYSGKVGL